LVDESVLQELSNSEINAMVSDRNNEFC